ncbi:hypothetical protein SMACR_04214 [Sordaria macrospora]|uniref:Uncharacterized protein n=1 Tax=Sordaria macrospora TaxID=5147 RepID=A0A8S8ZHT8_SORMA|nr:hypothetical protein SMACR_04214 [Sordaria macrospora]WPJ64514.1 hypothetical protein SMAC4_04214 [Sordaria macrospora]
MADINFSSSRRDHAPRKRPRIDSYFEVSSSEEDSTETAEGVPEVTTAKKNGSEQDTERHMPCGPCISRAFKTPGQKCYNQVDLALRVGNARRMVIIRCAFLNENDSRPKELVDGLQNIIREIRWHKRTNKRGNAQLPHTAASGPFSAGQPLFITLPHNSPNAEIAEENEHSTGQLEALEAIVSSTAKSPETLGLLVEIAEQMKERSKHEEGSGDVEAEDKESGSDDSEDEEDSSPSLSPSNDDESPSDARDYYLSLLSERHDRTDRPLISISDRDELLALAAARDDKIGGLLQRKYFVAKVRHGKERSRRTPDTRVEKGKKGKKGQTLVCSDKGSARAMMGDRTGR